MSYDLPPPGGDEASRRRAVRALTGASDLSPSLRPGAATAALPGTEEKVRAMTGRATRREALHHPDDLTAGDCAALGLSCTVGANGTPVWTRPEPGGELARRALILAALAALRLRRAEGKT